MAKQFNFPFLIILFGTLVCCKNPASNTFIVVDKVVKEADTIQLSGKDYVIDWGENKLPESIYLLDDAKKKDGYAIDYGEKGALSSISQWKNGMQDGHTFVFEAGALKAHQLFEAGNLVYEGKYDDQVKTEDQLYPKFVEEFFFEDKYYAKITFPVAYPGELEVGVFGYQAVVSALPDQTFQLVINDALDLNAFDLKLSYNAAAQDTLLGSEYIITRIVYEDEVGD